MIDLTKITDENVDDMMDAAGYGITYWALSATAQERVGGLEKYDFVIVEDDYDLGRLPHYLTRDAVRKAYVRLLDLDQGYVNDTIHGYFIGSWRDRDGDGIDAAWIDADAGDVLVQVACFGEVVYG